MRVLERRSLMKGHKNTPDQVVRKLRHAERLMAQGANIAEVLKMLEVSEQTYCLWRNQHGAMKIHDAKEVRRLREENVRLKRLVADQTIELQKELARDV
jgi:putative transposase